MRDNIANIKLQNLINMTTPKNEQNRLIGPSTSNVILGVGAFLMAVFVLFEGVKKILYALGNHTEVETFTGLGAAAGFTISGILIFGWGLSRFKSIPLSEAVMMLQDKDPSKRSRAIEALESADWEPVNEDDKASYLVASGKWEETMALGSKGVNKVCESITWEDAISKPILKALGQSKEPNAIKPLIVSLGNSKNIYRRDVAKTLKEITGKDFGNKQEAWLSWFGSELSKNLRGENTTIGSVGVYKANFEDINTMDKAELEKERSNIIVALGKKFTGSNEFKPELEEFYNKRLIDIKKLLGENKNTIFTQNTSREEQLANDLTDKLMSWPPKNECKEELLRVISREESIRRDLTEKLGRKPTKNEIEDAKWNGMNL